MYNDNLSEQGQMLTLLWDMYSDGEYVDAINLAESILEKDPGCANALGVLALVYEKIANASYEAGDIDGEREYLEKALIQYQKIVLVSSDCVAEQAKITKITAKLYGQKYITSEAKGFDFSAAFSKIAVKWDEYSRESWFKPAFISICVFIFALAVVFSAVAVNKNNKKELVANNTVKTEEFAGNGTAPNANYSAGAPNTANQDYYGQNYNGPMLNYTYESPEYKAQQQAKAAASGNQRNISPNSLVDQGTKTRNRSTNDSYNQNGAKRASTGVYNGYNNLGNMKYSLPYKDFEIRPSTPLDYNRQMYNQPSSDTSKESDSEKDIKKEKISDSSRIKAANALLNAAIRDLDAGDAVGMRQNALAAREIYVDEMAKGHKIDICKSNIETIDTLLGN